MTDEQFRAIAVRLLDSLGSNERDALSITKFGHTIELGHYGVVCCNGFEVYVVIGI